MMFTIVLGALSAVAEKPLRQAQDKPNLIVIFADDMGVTDVGAFHALYPGAPEAQLPPFTLDVTDALKTGANKSRCALLPPRKVNRRWAKPFN